MLPNLFDLYVIKWVFEARSCLFLNVPRILYFLCGISLIELMNVGL